MNPVDYFPWKQQEWARKEQERRLFDVLFDEDPGSFSSLEDDLYDEEELGVIDFNESESAL